MKKAVSTVYFIMLAAVVLISVFSLLYAKAHVTDSAGHPEEAVVLQAERVQLDADIREYELEIPETESAGVQLAFYTNHQCAEVYVDGVLVYSVQAGNSVFGRTPGARWNFVALRPKAAHVLVRITAVYPQVRNFEPEFYHGNGVQMALTMLRASMPEIIVSIVDFSIGIFLLVYYAIVRRRLAMGPALLYFGIFAALVGLWSLSEAEMTCFLLENRVAASYIGYVLIMLMIVPFVAYQQDFLEVRETYISNTLSVLSLLNLVVSVTLHMTGLLEFRRSVSVTHFLMLCALFYLFYALWSRIHTRGADRKVRSSLLGFGVLSVSLLLDIGAFYIGATKTDVIGRIGLLIYICILAKEVASNSLQKIDEGRKAQIYRELAVRDVLTRMYNRNAYHEWMKENHKPRNMAVVTFDLNDLKQCNDTYGHAAGDRYLQDAAAMLCEVFEPAGKCFRIGGDEFCAVVENAGRQWLSERLRILEQMERKYNRASAQVKIKIAYGFAFFDEGSDRDVEDTRNRADAQMYENKKKQKEHLKK